MAGWLAFAVGVMIKGPIILAVLAVTVVAISLWDRNWSWLKTIHPIPGILLTLAICLPWGIAIAFVSQGDFYKQALGQRPRRQDHGRTGKAMARRPAIIWRSPA